MREDQTRALMKGVALALKPMFAEIERRLAALERQVAKSEAEKAREARKGVVYADH